jgi:hypothetical protein
MNTLLRGGQQKIIFKIFLLKFMSYMLHGSCVFLPFLLGKVHLIQCRCGDPNLTRKIQVKISGHYKLHENDYKNLFIYIEINISMSKIRIFYLKFNLNKVKGKISIKYFDPNFSGQNIFSGQDNFSRIKNIL